MTVNAIARDRVSIRAPVRVRVSVNARARVRFSVRVRFRPGVKATASVSVRLVLWLGLRQGLGLG